MMLLNVLKSHWDRKLLINCNQFNFVRTEQKETTDTLKQRFSTAGFWPGNGSWQILNGSWKF